MRQAVLVDDETGTTPRYVGRRRKCSCCKRRLTPGWAWASKCRRHVFCGNWRARLSVSGMRLVTCVEEYARRHGEAQVDQVIYVGPRSRRARRK